MEEQSAPVERGDPPPVFTAYRRGYDPDQVDRYVAEQSARTDAADQRADEAERKLSIAVAQLHEMQKRISALEAREPGSPTTQPVQTIAIDTLGTHVQRILADAWEGSHALREEAEQEAATIRDRALADGDRIVASARRKAESVGEELARRREAYLERLEAERSKAVSQMTFLQQQRQLAVADLHRIKTLVDSTIAEVGTSSRPEPAPRAGQPAAEPSSAPRLEHPSAPPEPVLGATMPVHRIFATEERNETPDPSDLVRSHRARVEDEGSKGVIRSLRSHSEPTPPRPSFFDFDEQEEGGT